MVSSARELRLARLPKSVSHRLATCIRGEQAPRPLCAVPILSGDQWIYWLAGGAVVLLVLLFAVGDAPLAWPGIFLWAAGAVPLALGVAGWWHGWVAARAFPFPPGSYLFATELIQATAGKCHLFSMDELVDARPVITKDHQGVARAALQLVFQTGNVNLPVVSESAATRAIAGLWAGRDALAGALASEDWGQVATHDPLYEARHGGHWDQVAPIHGAAVWNAAGVPQARPGLGLGLPVGIAVGALAALALWWGSNALRDRLAFTRARTANTVKAWQRYVDLGTTSRRGEAAVHLAARRGSGGGEEGRFARGAA